MSNNIASQYPNMSFPSQYTKQGQKALIEKHINNVDSKTKADSNINNTNELPKSNINLHKLMPLIKSMSNNQKLNQNELLKMMLPMLTGGNNNDINDLICMFADKKKETKFQEIKETSSDKPVIASFRRVD